MGSWEVKNVSQASNDLDETDSSRILYGNTINVTFEIKYKKSSEEFKEMPPLEWLEEFTYIDHQKQNWWTFKANMYEHNLSSKNLRIWLRRYVSAYNAAKGIDDRSLNCDRGSCVLEKKKKKLFATEHELVNGNNLPDVTKDAEKTKAVQDYLKANGGRLVIVFTDKPSVGYSTDASLPANVERMLLFDVGLQNSTERWKGYQHVKLDQAHPQSWRRDVESGSPNNFRPPVGYSQIDPPVGVSTRRDSFINEEAGEVR